jgi:hypothetical protein
MIQPLEKLAFMRARAARLAKDVSVRRAQLGRAERQIALVDKLDDSIDDIITRVAAEPVPLPAPSENSTDEALICPAVGHEPEVFAALAALKADLPFIRAHHEAARDSALG